MKTNARRGRALQLQEKKWGGSFNLPAFVSVGSRGRCLIISTSPATISGDTCSSTALNGQRKIILKSIVSFVPVHIRPSILELAATDDGD